MHYKNMFMEILKSIWVKLHINPHAQIIQVTEERKGYQKKKR